MFIHAVADDLTRVDDEVGSCAAHAEAGGGLDLDGRRVFSGVEGIYQRLQTREVFICAAAFVAVDAPADDDSFAVGRGHFLSIHQTGEACLAPTIAMMSLWVQHATPLRENV